MSDLLRGWSEIAGFLRVSKRTAHRYHRKHDLPVYKVGHTVYALKAEVEQWMKDHIDILSYEVVRI